MKKIYSFSILNCALFIAISISACGPSVAQKKDIALSVAQKKDMEEKEKKQGIENAKLEEDRKKIDYCTAEMKSMKTTARKANSEKHYEKAIEILKPCFGIIEDGDFVELYVSSVEKLKEIGARKDVINAKRQGVSIEMTKEQVLASSWGRPQKVNKTHGSFGTHEQWVYGGGYLYFENGILTSVQN